MPVAPRLLAALVTLGVAYAGLRLYPSELPELPAGDRAGLLATVAQVRQTEEEVGIRSPVPDAGHHLHDERRRMSMTDEDKRRLADAIDRLDAVARRAERVVQESERRMAPYEPVFRRIQARLARAGYRV